MLFCDGQLEELLRSCLIHHFSEFKRIVIGNGFFHAFIHFLFCANTGYWYCCCCTFACWLGKRKQIYQSMNDLQHDNARHILDFHRVNTAGILSYLLLDVQNPPPALLLQDPRGYLAVVNVGGGEVILQYLFEVGLIAVFWQRKMREGSGKPLTACLAIAFHFHRSIAHKVKSVYIALIALMGLTTAHPKIAKALEDYCCVSLLGRIFIPFDRLLEYVNLLQQKRGTAFRSFDAQLQFSEYLQPLIHCDAAWKTADGAGTGLDDGLPSYLRNDVAQIRRKLRETLGTDLMINVPGNALWHTGNAVPLDGGDYRQRQPWRFRKKVAAGNTAGVGRSSAMSWDAFVRDWLENHWR